MSASLSPGVLWRQAYNEHPGVDHRSIGSRRARYLELMREHGHIIDREPGDTAPLLPCGYDPRPESGETEPT